MIGDRRAADGPSTPRRDEVPRNRRRAMSHFEVEGISRDQHGRKIVYGSVWFPVGRQTMRHTESRRESFSKRYQPEREALS